MAGWVWPWHHEPLPEPPEHANPEEAKEALHEAEQTRQEALANTNTIRKLAEQLRAHRTENHFADLFTQSLKERR